MKILTQFYGVVLCVLSVACISRTNTVLAGIRTLAYRPNLLFVIGAFEFTVGAILVLLYSGWSSLQAVIVSVIHWELVVEGLLLLFFPKLMSRLSRNIKSKQIVQASSIIMLAVGVLLAGFGFEIVA